MVAMTSAPAGRPLISLSAGRRTFSTMAAPASAAAASAAMVAPAAS